MAAGQADDADGLSNLRSAYRSHSVAEAWQRGSAARAGPLGPVTETMLDLAGVGPGSRVLDVAAGTGEQTLLAAQRVGPDGFVLAIDIAPEMLALAAASARAANLQNVGTLVEDAQALQLDARTFDAGICRSGLMLMADPVAALVSVRRALKPGGRLSVLVFGRVADNPL